MFRNLFTQKFSRNFKNFASFATGKHLILKTKHQHKLIKQQSRNIHRTNALNISKIDQLELDQSSWLNIHFKDGSSQKFLSVWLRDNCKCVKCFDLSHGFRMSDFWLPDASVKPHSFELVEDGQLKIIWKENDQPEHQSFYCPTWLQECSKEMSKNRFNVIPINEQRGKQHFWTNSVLAHYGKPEVQFETFLNDKNGVKDFLKLFHQFGFVIIKNSPLTNEAIEDFSKKLTYIKESSFGRIADVCIGPESKLHPAYTGLSIHFHTDLTYKEKSPGVLSLHCLRNANPKIGESGGETQLADGFQVAQWVKTNHPNAYNILTKIPIPYSYTDPTTEIVYNSYWPVIGLDPLEHIREIHFSNFARKTLNFSPDVLSKVYSALKLFADRLYDPESALGFYLEPGDILTINNRRVLHARSQFDPNKIIRHLRTIYMDLDEVYGVYDALLKSNHS